MILFVWIILFFSLSAGAKVSPVKNIDFLPVEFRDEARVILKYQQEFDKNKTAESSVILDLDDGASVSIFSKAGFFNIKDCEEDARQNYKKPANQCKIVGKSDNKAKLVPTGEIEFRVEEDEEGEQVLRSYSQINFFYERQGPKSGTGWIATDYISYKPISPSYSEIAIEKMSQAQDWLKNKWKAICEMKSPQASSPLSLHPAQKKNLKELALIPQAVQKDLENLNRERKTVSEIASVLSTTIGKCVLNPPKKVPESFSRKITYDEFVLPQVMKTNIPVGIKNELGQPMSSQDLVDIDALARTMFAEMASCTPIGAQYPMAVARVIRNREQAMKENSNYIQEFVKKNELHDPSKSLLCKAATSPVLFSAWNQEIIDFDALKAARLKMTEELLTKAQKRVSKKIANKLRFEAEAKAKKAIRENPKTGAYYKKNVSGMLHTLCPPSDPVGLCYTGGRPDQNLTSIWQNTVKVATEAVLFPKQFAQKTDELKNIKHYTSNRSKFYDFKQVHPSIEGRPISSGRCLNLWRPPTTEEKKRAGAKKKKQ